jgi:hypothetical protein
LGDLVLEHPDRIDIYRDNLLFGLLDVLAEVFEITRSVIGIEAFKALGRDYIRSHPQTTGDRTQYGAGLADFMAEHPALSDQIWLSELARMEWALHHAHHADDAEALAFDQLLSDIPLALPAGAQIIATTHDVFALVQTFHTGALDDFTLTVTPQTRLIWRRPDDAVVSRLLTPLEARFLQLFAYPAALAAHLSSFSSDDFPALQALLAETVPAGLFIEARPA